MSKREVGLHDLASLLPVFCLDYCFMLALLARHKIACTVFMQSSVFDVPSESGHLASKKYTNSRLSSSSAENSRLRYVNRSTKSKKYVL